jgi:hypothetical protein
MFASVDTRVPEEVEAQLHSIYRKLFPAGEAGFVLRAFDWATACFTGGLPDYQPIDARYHDFEHTLQGTLCLARLLHGRHLAGAQPVMTQRMFELALLAILFHDTGYLKKRGDNEGTGAKYTLTHVIRSAEFARQFLARKGYDEPALAAVANMISCTGVNADLRAIPFQSELERTLGFALATADLLGQMAARDYVEKLPMLYLEFVEAARQGGEKVARFASYKSVEELMRNTPAFWEDYVLPKINNDFKKLHQFLNEPWPDGPNCYLQRIEENLARLQKKLEASAAGAPRPRPARS